MATVGQQLLAPEEGWKRVEETNSNIIYNGSGWVSPAKAEVGIYSGGTMKESKVTGDSAQFNFRGTKLRMIGDRYQDKSSSILVYIDNLQAGVIDQYISKSEVTQSLDFEVKELEDKEHSVKIVNDGTGYFAIDAIDIDETGELLPYNPDDKSDQVLLRVTMLDSSEREYRLAIKEVEEFVNWYKRTLGTGDSCYELSDIVDNSKEYLAFEKIISFKVIPLNN
ncbi:hypothetical protein [Anaerosinus massiliensis]|uniref:hypothetical protein n=1 Tax=Massilibacillus massiliensis TaxID=1806837 RepID=UPI000DA5EEC4|nr:hypothetical protein [Massilibacillus massiliensis]